MEFEGKPVAKEVLPVNPFNVLLLPFLGYLEDCCSYFTEKTVSIEK